VVLVHGFLCNRGLWLSWMPLLRSRGHAYVAVNLEPVFGSIDAYAATVDEAVRRVTQATGLPPVILAHSMGGLATRAWLRAFSADARVHRVITLGTPHGGTWLGRWSQATNGRQMQLASPWLQQLQLDEPLTRARLFTCWYSNCDNIVFPARTAALPGARQRFVAGLAHVEMACDQQVMAECLEELAQAD
jgi:pimeloyl-ACP methyl ester carboxylesterase